MYSLILKDYFYGFFYSFNFLSVIKVLIKDNKLRKLLIKIIFYNFLLHVIPYFVFYYIFHHDIPTIIKIILNIASFLFHVIHYMDLLRDISRYCDQIYLQANREIIDIISLGITMSIYGSVICFATEIINIVFNFYSVKYIINFFLLSIYHSLYCFNGVWQYYQISITTRIDIHERLWPYYLGYGTIATLIYLNTNIYWMYAVYNIYCGIIIMIPFLQKPYLPRKKKYYFSINLSIFSYLTFISIKLSLWIFKFIF
jgi:hypothetical protein